MDGTTNADTVEEIESVAAADAATSARGENFIVNRMRNEKK